MRCEYDTGSMYGNRPACSAPATHQLTQPAYGGYGPYVLNLCELHVQSTKGRIWPLDYTVTELGTNPQAK